MTITTQVFVIAAADTDGFGAALTSTGATYVLTSDTVADGAAHFVTFKNNTASSHAGKTIAFVGTDENGLAISETITGPAGNATVTTTKYFKTLATVIPSASTGADTFDIGWAANAVTPWFRPTTTALRPVNIGVGVTVVAGSPSYTLRRTYDGVAWFAHSTIATKTASFDGVETTPCLGLQLILTVAGSLNVTYVDFDGR